MMVLKLLFDRQCFVITLFGWLARNQDKQNLAGLHVRKLSQYSIECTVIP
jgi:hypothetical protein